MGTSQDGIRVEECGKRVRAYIGGHLVADTTRPSLVWEIPYYPMYYIPEEDVRAELKAEGPAEGPPELGEGTSYTVMAGGREVHGAARSRDALPGLIRLDWKAMDGWFEEDEEVFIHPRDPHHRLDILASSRHVRVEVDGVTVAESSSPRMLFETSLPVRYYLPKAHVRMDLLEPTATVTGCPYKGTAEYWSVRVNGTVHQDLAWGYRAPVAESQKIAGLVCFYDEKVDVFVDGVRQERPITPF
ncbi:DUF427 domain-containing protein [Spirillospora albida]|uniref:DUF427 domain-containing protein n=1 Tax=Spirillospora albida TaxID=58123 RepID=UPI0004C1FA13|nr:DUF427 domain-containing protein [Spirillospora albida]